MVSGRWLAAGVTLVAAIAAAAYLLIPPRAPIPSSNVEQPLPPAEFVGAATVLGDFSKAKSRYAGVESTFFRRDGRFMVRTDGPDGKLADYEVKYAFGVTRPRVTRAGDASAS